MLSPFIGNENDYTWTYVTSPISFLVLFWMKCVTEFYWISTLLWTKQIILLLDHPSVFETISLNISPNLNYKQRIFRNYRPVSDESPGEYCFSGIFDEALVIWKYSMKVLEGRIEYHSTSPFSSPVLRMKKYCWNSALDL